MQMAQAQQPYWNSFPGGNVITTNEWLGADYGSLIPLRIQTRANQPIDFSTADRFRARINERVTYSSLNTFPNIPADGFTLITPDMGFLNQPPRGPFSRLHLAEGGEDGNAEQWGYRPWQRNGVTFTGNTDQGYIGQKFREGGEGETDMVIQWSDNPGVDKADRLRFIFTSAYDYGATTGMNSEEGLEGMRLWPTWENRINVGIGDFYLYGGDPTERLHVRDGRVRIQQLPTDPEATTLDQYMVVDHDGVVKWRHLPTVPPVDPCASGWSLVGNNPVTAYNGNPCPPQGSRRVGIGTDDPQAAGCNAYGGRCAAP